MSASQPHPPRTLRAGTRGSRLALAQTEWVLERLRPLLPDTTLEPVVIRTTGDRSATAPRGTGVFVKEVQEALRAGDVDLAVHSLKDLPTDPVEGITLAAVPERADPRDAIVGSRLADLPLGARVGTGSPRRVAQLRRARPDLDVVPLRGNVPTRVQRVREGEIDAAVLAAAGLERLGLAADEILDHDVLLPAPGQGALAVEVRSTDTALARVVAALDDAATRIAVTAERAVLRALGGGCMLPLATLAIVEDRTLTIHAAATSADGTRQVRCFSRGARADAHTVAERVASELESMGARELL
ncbi:MAG: hydroxymethylbilane synthase [Actinomycetota bacterium]